MPTLVLGMAPLHKPGTQVGQNAIRALADIAQRGHPAYLLAGDRAYTQCKPEDFQLPARSLGYQLVLDYKIDQLGLQGAHQGMMVDGSFYCPAMSESLINATKDFRDGRIDEATHRARITERQRLAIRARSQPDADGHLRVMCPAANPAPQVRCQLKPASEGGNGKLRTRIPPSPTSWPPTGRRSAPQGSIALLPDAGAKFRQNFAHETDEWHRADATLRNSNEGMNGFIKDGAREAVDDPETPPHQGRRRPECAGGLPVVCRQHPQDQ